MNKNEIRAVESLFAEAVENDDMEEFGVILVSHLDSLGITLTEFADEIGLSRPTVWRMFSTEHDTRKQTFGKVLDGIGLKMSVVAK